MTAVADTLGRNRADALWRTVFGVLMLVTVFAPLLFLLTIGVAAAVIWHVVDALWQLLTNDSGLSTGGSGLDAWAERLYDWPLDMVEWWLFGAGDFPWMP